MAIIKIVTTPHPILVRKANKVRKFDAKLKTLIEDMKETLLSTVDPVGVGLAAPQIGMSLRIFQMKPSEKSTVSIHINPVIEFISDEESVPEEINSEKIHSTKPGESRGKLLEGCLSIPDIWGNVSRKRELNLTWQDESGKSHTKLFKGFPAVIIQHEVDHLNGILFTKHVMEQKEKLYKSHKDEQGEDVFDEIKL